MSKEDFRVAVVGLGKMGWLHASILNVLPNVKLEALCDKSVIIRRFSRKLFKRIHIVDDVEKLSDLSLDAVFVTTPISSHFSVVDTVYTKEIAPNLFVEKTLTSDYEKSRELCELAKRSGHANMVGYPRRFGVTYKKAKDLLAQDAIGEVTSFRAYAYSSDFFESNRGSKAPTLRGGVLLDLGCHAVDLALWFLGDLQVNSAKLASIFDSCSEDSAYFTAKTKDGFLGEFDVSWCVKNYRLPEVGVLISGSKGTIEVNDDRVKVKLNPGKHSIWYRHDLNDDVDFLLGGPEYFREDWHFVKAATDDLNPEPSFHTASKVDQIIDQVRHRADTNE